MHEFWLGFVMGALGMLALALYVVNRLRVEVGEISKESPEDE